MQVPEGVPNRHVQSKLLEITQEHCLAQVVNIHTRADKTLDLLLTNSPSPVNRVKGMPPIGKADHDIVYVEYDIIAKCIQQALRKIYLYKRADMDGLRDHLARYRDSFLSSENQQAYAEEMCSKIRSLYQTHPRSTIWIAGDANLPDIDWDINTINGHSNPNILNHMFLDTVCDNGSEQMVKFPTRQKNTLDVFVTNRPSPIQKCKPVPGVSDHDIVFVESNISAIRSKPPQRKIFLWKRANYVGMKESVSLASASFVAKNKDIDRHQSTMG